MGTWSPLLSVLTLSQVPQPTKSEKATSACGSCSPVSGEQSQRWSPTSTQSLPGHSGLQPHGERDQHHQPLSSQLIVTEAKDPTGMSPSGRSQTRAGNTTELRERPGWYFSSRDLLSPELPTSRRTPRRCPWPEQLSPNLLHLPPSVSQALPLPAKDSVVWTPSLRHDKTWRATCSHRAFT